MKYDLVYIEWEDPTFYSFTKTDKMPFMLTIQRTAGMCVMENEKYIRVALTVDEDNVGEFIDIPKTLIKKIRWIKLKKN